MILRIIIFATLFNITFSEQYVVLLGGWKSKDGSCWIDLHKHLEEDDNIKAKLIYDIPIETINNSITNQVTILETELINRGLKDGDNIVFVAHSQGGLRSWYFLKQFHKKYNIKGIFTAGTPWQGANIISSFDIMERWSERICILFSESISSGISFLPSLINSAAKSIISNKKVIDIVFGMFRNRVEKAGSILMKPDSDLIKDINKSKERCSCKRKDDKKTFFGAIVGNNTNIEDSWIIKEKHKYIDSRVKVIEEALSLFTFSYKKSKARVSIRLLSNEISIKGLNIFNNNLIKSTRHDTLIREDSQLISSDILNSIVGVKGEYIEGTYEKSHYINNMVHGTHKEILIKKHLETHNRDVIKTLAKWVLKALNSGDEK